MLASTPSQHLESDFRPSRNPTNESTFRNRALGAYQRCPLFRGRVTPELAGYRGRGGLAAPRPRRVEIALGRGVPRDGRVTAAAAIAIVSVKDPAHFRMTPGGYFHGMVPKAKTGELNPARSMGYAFRKL
jgi:hypothetical protein